MNDTIKIVGVKTEEEVLKLIAKEKQEMENANQEHKKEFLREQGIISCIAMVVTTIAWFIWQFWEVFLIFACAGLLILIERSCSDGTPIYSFKKTEYSLACQYYWLTKGKNILYTRVKDCDVEFVLEDKETHIVTETTLTGFKTVYRTDISNILVDLEKSCIAYPYPKGGSNS